MERITIKNLGKHIKYEPDDTLKYDEETGCNSIIFVWDCGNEKIDNLANNEYRYCLGDKKKNLMWIEELKRIANWKPDEYIYAYTKTNADGYFSVYYKKDKIGFNWYNVIIEPSGFVCMGAFNLYNDDRDEDIKFSKIFIRVDSVYNDSLIKKN
jgi:hypothetical protein